jgi:hypothetical protein
VLPYVLRGRTPAGAHISTAKVAVSQPAGFFCLTAAKHPCQSRKRDTEDVSLGQSDITHSEGVHGSRQPRLQHFKRTRSGGGAWSVCAYHGDAGTQGKTGSNGGRSNPAGRCGRSTSSTDATTRHYAIVIALRTPNSRAGDGRTEVAPRRTRDNVSSEQLEQPTARLE